MAPAKKKSAGKLSRVKTSKDEASSSKQSDSSTPSTEISFNVVKQFDLLQRNGVKGCYIHKSGESIISQRLKHFSVFKILNVFDRRVTCISWHPSKLFFIAGSKAGDMTLFNYTSEGDTFTDKFSWSGPGPGLSLMSVHFPQHMENKFLTTCIDGTVKLWDFENMNADPMNTLMSTGTLQRWFCSVSSCAESNVILVGDTKGNLITIDKHLKVVSTDKIHKNKVNTVEFSKKGGWTFATASVDQTVKLFDLRNLKEAVNVFQHIKGVNSAYFSKTSSGRLLTTDQDCELRVYKGPMWRLERIFRHPHRQFMYLTPIRATWHPMADLVAVGRYPDDSKSDLRHMTLRTVDFYSAESGMMKNELYSADCSSILSLNEFSPCGDFIASAMGLYIPVWRFTHSSLKHKLTLYRGNKGNLNDDSDDSGPPKIKRPRKSDKSKSGISKS